MPEENDFSVPTTVRIGPDPPSLFVAFVGTPLFVGVMALLGFAIPTCAGVWTFGAFGFVWYGVRRGRASVSLTGDELRLDLPWSITHVPRSAIQRIDYLGAVFIYTRKTRLMLELYVRNAAGIALFGRRLFSKRERLELELRSWLKQRDSTFMGGWEDVRFERVWPPRWLLVVAGVSSLLCEVAVLITRNGL